MIFPSQTGVYLLSHDPSGHCYVGSSTRLGERRRFWLEIVASLNDEPWDAGGPQLVCGVLVGFGVCRMPQSRFNGAAVSRRLAACFERVGSLGWSWSVVEFLDDWAAPEVVWRSELREIEAARARAGDRCLNTHRVRPTEPLRWGRALWCELPGR